MHCARLALPPFVLSSYCSGSFFSPSPHRHQILYLEHALPMLPHGVCIAPSPAWAHPSLHCPGCLLVLLKWKCFPNFPMSSLSWLGGFDLTFDTDHELTCVGHLYSPVGCRISCEYSFSVPMTVCSGRKLERKAMVLGETWGLNNSKWVTRKGLIEIEIFNLRKNWSWEVKILECISSVGTSAVKG